MRYLAIDLGRKRTGLALGDDQTKLVSPLAVIELPEGPPLLEALVKTIDEQKPVALVVGLPIKMEGGEGAAAQHVREFARTLQLRTGLDLHFQDERLTSFAADQQMAQTGRTHKQKKELRDALAAAEILRDFLENKRP